jgi:hypothetical protein
MVAVVLVFSSAGFTAGHNFGSGTNDKPQRKCLNRGDMNPDEDKSECTTINSSWYVYVHPDVSDEWWTSILSSMINDYTISGIWTPTLQEARNSDTDTYVIATSAFNGADYGIYTTCEPEPGVFESGGNGLYRFCQEQWIIWDDMHPWSLQFFGSGQQHTHDRNWLACHELGHTTGLQHYPGNKYAANNSCMSYHADHYQTLRDHDIEHLDHCYPRPIPYQDTLTESGLEFGI